MYGEGSTAEDEHRLSCIECARRFRRLEQDMTLIGNALSEPAVSRLARRDSSRRVRTAAPRLWQPLAAAAAVVIGFAMVWTQFADVVQPQGTKVAGEAATGGPSRPPREIALKGAPATRIARAALPEFDASVYLDAALGGALPCGWDDPLESGCGAERLRGAVSMPVLSGGDHYDDLYGLGFAEGYGFSDADYFAGLFGVGG